MKEKKEFLRDDQRLRYLRITLSEPNGSISQGSMIYLFYVTFKVEPTGGLYDSYVPYSFWFSINSVLLVYQDRYCNIFNFLIRK